MTFDLCWYPSLAGSLSGCSLAHVGTQSVMVEWVDE